MRGVIVGVLRGGPSHEYEISLKSGAAVLASLPDLRFTARDLFIDQEGSWHDRGKETTPERALRGIDVAINTLHGEYGESGEVQQMLERFGIPYTGADAFGSFIAKHKLLAKEKAKELGLKTPEYRFIQRGQDVETGAADAVRSFHQPVVVKPVGWGSSAGVSIVGGYAPVLAATKKLFAEGADGVLIEEKISGKEATAGVVEGLRGETLYSLPVVEIVPPENDFFSYDAKYGGTSTEIVPGNFSRVHTEELARAARLMHKALGQRHYSRSDFIVSPKGIYFLETNSAAGVGLTEQSLLPKSLAAVGISFSEFLSHIIELALKR